jgi:hypothetical protein
LTVGAEDFLECEKIFRLIQYLSDKNRLKPVARGMRISLQGRQEETDQEIGGDI